MAKKSISNNTLTLFPSDKSTPKGRPLLLLRPELDPERANRFHKETEYIEALPDTDNHYQLPTFSNTPKADFGYITRKHHFNSLRVTPKVIRALVEIVYTESRKWAHRTSISKYGYTCSKERSCVKTSPDAFKDGGILEVERVINVWISFETDDCKIAIQISHTHEANIKNHITVSGNDETWVCGIHARLIECINRCERIPRVVKYIRLIFIMLAFWCGCTIVSLFDYFNLLKEGGALAIFLVFILLIAQCYAFFRVTRYLEPMWPSVELITGPSHVQNERKNRKRLFTLISMIVIPVAISISCNLLTARIGQPDNSQINKAQVHVNDSTPIKSIKK